MLKRGRSKSEARDGGGRAMMGFASSSPTIALTDSNAHSGDSQRKCAFTAESYQVLNELRMNNLLCDTRISTKKDHNGREYAVHRLILAACSPYFRLTFSSMQQNESSPIQLDIEIDALEALIDYAYTRECNVTSANVTQIIDAAKLCQMKSLIQYCCDYLEKSLTDENIFYVFNFANTHSDAKLCTAAYEYLMYHFINVTKTNLTFLELPFDQLIQFITTDDLNARNEENVFDACIKWIDHNAEERKRFIAQLLGRLRLGLIPLRIFSNKIKQHPYVKDNDECKPIIGETLRLLYKLNNEGLLDTDVEWPFIRPRYPHEIMFAFGGWSGGNATNILEAYNARADKWTVVSTEPVPPRAYHGCIALDDQIFVIGGFDGTEYFSSCRVFHLIRRLWNDIAPMNERRCYVSVACLNGMLYALGGFNGHVRQNTAERYNHQTNQWSAISPMHMQRSDASACTLNECVYICGGFDGQECLQNAEYYNPITNQWTMIRPMRSRRSGVGVIAYRGSIYAIGGFNGTSRLNTGERYNPAMNTWRSITDMFHPRSNFAIEVLDDLIFTIGGFNGITTVTNVECYDDTTNEWYDIADMNLFRSALSACVVSGLTYTREFLIHANDISTNGISTQASRSPPVIAASEVGPITTTTASVRLPSGTLASLNQGLRNFTHGRIQ